MSQTTANKLGRKKTSFDLPGCLIYTRVSTQRQAEEGYSLNQQADACRQLARKKGYGVLRVYREEGASGTSMARPQFQEMLSRCGQDKRVKAVIIIHTDRLARNTLEHLTVKTILKRHQVELLSVLQPMLDDSPEGNLMDIVLAGVNEFYSRDLARKISKGMMQKVKEGWYPLQAPLGYKNIRNPATGESTIVVDKTKGPYMTKAFNLYKTGKYSVQSLIDKLYQEGLRSFGGKKVHLSVMARALSNIFYTGKISYKGHLYQGKHKALVSMNTYQEVHRILDLHNRGASRTRKHKYLLSGFLFCHGCGSQLTGEHHMKKSGLVFDYYRCNGGKNRAIRCKQPYSRTNDLEEQVAEAFDSISLPDEYTSGLQVAYRHTVATQSVPHNQQIKLLENRRQGIEKRMDSLEDQLLDGVMDQDRVTRKYKHLKVELSTTVNQLDKINNPSEVFSSADFDEIVAFIKNLGNIYRNSGLKEKKLLLQTFTSKIWVKNKKIVKINYTDNLQKILEKDMVRITSVLWTIRELIRTLTLTLSFLLFL